MRLALYQPDIPQNTGTVLRLAACMNVAVDLIEPAGFDMSSRALRRAGLDYLAHVELARHACFEAFCDSLKDRLPRPRLLLATTRAQTRYIDVKFQPADVILLGRESSGVPQHVHDAAQLRFAIPMKAGLRSLNVAMAAAMILGEALRQCRLFPTSAQPQTLE